MPSACAGHHPVALSHLNAWTRCGHRTVSRNVILCDGTPFARVDCVGAGVKQCRALTLTYQDGSSLIIYAAPGVNPNEPREIGVEGKAGFFNSAYYPELAPDGSMVWFKKGSVGQGQWQIYLVRDGRLRDADPGYIWELRDLQFDGRSVPIE